MRLIGALCLALAAGTGAAAGPAVAQTSIAPASLSEAKGSFRFAGWAGPALRVWYQLPDKVTADTPVVFVMHGVNRDADRYRDEWAPLASRYGFILAVPEFANAEFPGSLGYNLGYFEGRDGKARPRAQWSFAAIEPLFDNVRARTGTRVARYSIYGHSAGGQFVHRFVMFMPEARIERAIAANPGWYTMPLPGTDYPYGLRRSPAREAELRAALGKRLTVLLGSADVDRQASNLRHTPEAEAQGPHRFARGQNFFASARAAAAELKTPFGWELVEVPGVGHKNALMAQAAPPILAGANR